MVPVTPDHFDPKVYESPDCLWIFTDGSSMKAMRMHEASAGWGLVVHAGASETSVEEQHGPLGTPPDGLVLPSTLPSTNNKAELQGMQMAARWLLRQAEGGAQYKAVVICPDSTYALNHVQGIITPKKHIEYVTQGIVQKRTAWVKK